MTYMIGFISQKGGVGKSTLARLLARELAAGGMNVKIADLDISQGTSFTWQKRRLGHSVEPEVSVEQFGTVDKVLQIAETYDAILMDGAPHATKASLDIAKHADVVVIPSGLAVDDLEPNVLLAHELIKAGIPKSKIVFALNKVGESEIEIGEARDYIEGASYTVLKPCLRDVSGYRRASDIGRSMTETRYKSLNKQAEEMAQAIIDHLGAQ